MNLQKQINHSADNLEKLHSYLKSEYEYLTQNVTVKYIAINNKDDINLTQKIKLYYNNLKNNWNTFLLNAKEKPQSNPLNYWLYKLLEINSILLWINYELQEIDLRLNYMFKINEQLNKYIPSYVLSQIHEIETNPAKIVLEWNEYCTKNKLLQKELDLLLSENNKLNIKYQKEQIKQENILSLKHLAEYEYHQIGTHYNLDKSNKITNEICSINNFLKLINEEKKISDNLLTTEKEIEELKKESCKIINSHAI